MSKQNELPSGVPGIPGVPAAFENCRRVAILGVGNELNGDDIAGILVVRQLIALLRDTPALKRQVVVYEGATAPENFAGPLRRFAPDLILMVDAAHLEEPPGSVAWIDWQDTEGVSAGTHGFPPSVFARYLLSELGCRVGLVGIQPAHLDFDRPVTPAVATTAEALAVYLVRWLVGIDSQAQKAPE